MVFIGLDALFPVIELIVGAVFPTQTKKVVAFKAYPGGEIAHNTYLVKRILSYS